MKDAYIHLGIPPTAAIEEIEDAYEKKKRLFDPSRFPEGSPEREEARKMRTSLDLAYHFAVASWFAPARKEATNVFVPQTVPMPRTCNRSKIVPVAMLLTVAGAMLFLWADGGKRSTPVPPARPTTPEPQAQTERLDLTAQPKIPALPPPQTEQTVLVDRLLNATVLIEVWDGDQKISWGSGFFVNAKGDVLTNFHVIEGGSRILVTLRNGKTSLAKIRVFDNARDIALLALDSSVDPIVLLPRNRALPKSGENIWVAGAPRGYMHTISNGIVAAIRESRSGNLYIQITAPISPGSSGGPVANANGEIMGMATLSRLDGQNLNFAIASTEFNDFITRGESLSPLPPARAKKSPAPLAKDRTSIPLPDEKGFMGHPWGSSFADLKKRLSKLEPLKNRGSSVTYYSTGRAFPILGCKADVIVTYGFYKNQLCEIFFDKAEGVPGEKVQEIYDELVGIYGEEGEEADQNTEIYFWKNGDVIVFLAAYPDDDSFSVLFAYWPIIEKLPKSR